MDLAVPADHQIHAVQVDPANLEVREDPGLLEALEVPDTKKQPARCGNYLHYITLSPDGALLGITPGLRRRVTTSRWSLAQLRRQPEIYLQKSPMKPRIPIIIKSIMNVDVITASRGFLATVRFEDRIGHQPHTSLCLRAKFQLQICWNSWDMSDDGCCRRYCGIARFPCEIPGLWTCLYNRLVSTVMAGATNCAAVQASSATSRAAITSIGWLTTMVNNFLVSEPN